MVPTSYLPVTGGREKALVMLLAREIINTVRMPVMWAIFGLDISGVELDGGGEAGVEGRLSVCTYTIVSRDEAPVWRTYVGHSAKMISYLVSRIGCALQVCCHGCIGAPQMIDWV